MDKEKLEAAKDAVRAYLGTDIYICTRDESAWGYGTMGLDDFELASEDENIVTDLATDVAKALGMM